MTAQPIEYPSSPSVALNFAPIQLGAEARMAITAANAATSPAEVWAHALMGYKAYAIQHAKKELLGKGDFSDGLIRETMDTAWQIFVPKMKQLTGPMIAEAYLSAFQKAQSGELPARVVYNLAEQHAERVGKYFNDTSNDALIQGFNTYVNRRVPQRAALERALDAYGLTPRQMSGLTSSKAFDDKVLSANPRDLKLKMLRYIGKSLRDRLKVFTEQETHNLSEQANQVAWMWMMEHGHLPAHAEKMWLTSRDEKVCAICGPMHRVKVPVREQFIFDSGAKLYVPGAHVNCRCTVRLMIPVVEIGKDAAFERRVKRDRGGRFAEVEEVRRDPQLEAMVAEAKQIKEEEEEARLRAIEEAVPAEGLGISPEEGKPAPMPKPTLGLRPVGVGGPGIGIRPKKVEKPEALGISPEVKRVAARIASGINISPPSDNQLLVGTALWLKQQAKEPIEYQPKLPQISGHVQFLGANDQPVRVYYLPSKKTDVPITEYDELVQIGRHDTLRSFDDDPVQVSRFILDRFKDNIEEKLEDLMDSENAWSDMMIDDPESEDFDHGDIYETETFLRVHKPGSRKALHTDLTRDQVRQVLNAVAHDADWAKNASVEVEWFGTDDRYAFTEKVYLRDLAQADEIDVYPGEFTVDIITLDKGYEDTFFEDPGSKYGERYYRSPGTYEVIGTDYPTELPIEGVPVRRIQVEPFSE